MYAFSVYVSRLRWTADDIGIVVDDLATDDPVMTARVTTPAGDVDVMAEPVIRGRRLLLEGLHLHGVTLGPGELGWPTLRALAQAVMDKDGLG